MYTQSLFWTPYHFTFMSVEVDVIITFPAASWTPQLLERVCECILRLERFVRVEDLWRGVGGVMRRLLITVCKTKKRSCSVEVSYI